MEIQILHREVLEAQFEITSLTPPATALPATSAGITFNGFFAANGIAPSVINANPKIQFVFAASFSSVENKFLFIVFAKAIISGGVIPPAITAAINVWFPSANSSVPVT